MQKRCTVDLWTAGCAGSRLTAPARSPMDKPWTTLRVAHNLPTGRRLPTSSTALDLIGIKSGKVKTNTPAPALAYSPPVTVQTSGTTAGAASVIGLGTVAGFGYIQNGGLDFAADTTHSDGVTKLIAWARGAGAGATFSAVDVQTAIDVAQETGCKLLRRLEKKGAIERCGKLPGKGGPLLYRLTPADREG